MKKNIFLTLCGLTLLCLALYAPSALGEEVIKKETTTTTTTTSSGTVSSVGPESIVIRTSPSASPLTYQFSETTTYVDEAGNPVEIETVTSGAPVVVHFSKTGDKMVASKVVVKKTTVTR